MTRTFESRLARAALAGSLLPVVIALLFIWTRPHDLKTRLTLTGLACAPVLIAAVIVRERATRALQTLGNLIGAVREGDYSMRARRGAGGALGDAYAEIDGLSRHLRELRLGDVESAALLDAVIDAVDVAILAFDDDEGRLRLCNRAAERVLGQPAGRLLGREATDIGLGDLLAGDAPRTLPLGGAAWELRRAQFRQGGRPHTLILLADVTRARREEELAAWQKLVRVLGHEIGNSLGPIQSVAGVLRQGLATEPTPRWTEDARSGLALIERRAESLARFTSAYARLARLPPPRLAPVEVEPWIRRAAALASVQVVGGPPVYALGDADQLDQLLINLCRNAAEAAAETGGDARVHWSRVPGRVRVVVEDDGPGLPPSANLFVPFFTTKPAGTGVGLVLARQIAEAHGGTLALRDRKGARGCEAVVELPTAA